MLLSCLFSIFETASSDHHLLLSYLKKKKVFSYCCTPLKHSTKQTQYISRHEGVVKAPDSQSCRHRSRLMHASSVLTALVTQRCIAALWFANIQTRSSFIFSKRKAGQKSQITTYLQHKSTRKRYTGTTEMHWNSRAEVKVNTQQPVINFWLFPTGSTLSRCVSSKVRYNSRCVYVCVCTRRALFSYKLFIEVLSTFLSQWERAWGGGCVCVRKAGGLVGS